MKPAARIAAAAEILDYIFSGEPAEKVLTGWARRSRFAGSKDRAALRDIVFDALRKRNSYAARGGALTGRAVMLGRAVLQGEPVEEIFSGERFALAELSEAERKAISQDLAEKVINLPDWVVTQIADENGEEAAQEIGVALEERAQVFVRANLLKATPENAIERLGAEGVIGVPHPHVRTAIKITEGARLLASSTAYQEGYVEVQDASSQAAVALLPLEQGDNVLDYCAGGGGKALAIAARTKSQVDAYDISFGRMKDIPSRATRAGAEITCHQQPPEQLYDLVFCDAPCSGSGTWRRTPDMKWRFSEARMVALQAQQAEVLRKAAPLVRAGGFLAYATCSILRAENFAQVKAFVDDSGEFSLVDDHSWLVSEEGDGFYLAILQKQNTL